MNNEIIQKKILSYNNYLLNKAQLQERLGLLDGKLGLSIYLYAQYREFQDKVYESRADKWLKFVLDNIDKISDYSLATGLTGIGVGVMYLLEKGFCEGNPNHILKEIDDALFKALSISLDNKGSNPQEDIIKCLYFCRRMRHTGLSGRERVLFEELITRSFNKVSNSMPFLLGSEPPVFSPTSYSLLLYLYWMTMMSDLHLYETKIMRIKQEWGEKISAVHPLSIGHRYLLERMISMVPNTPQYKLLNRNTSIEDFFSLEMRNYSLTFESGVSGLWLFMRMIGIQDARINCLIKEKIESSELWLKLEDDSSTILEDNLFMGLPGIILTYQDLSNYA